MAKKQKYQIRMRDGTIQTVEGTVVGNWGVDKRTVMMDGKPTLSYFLTHIPSGILITNAKTQKKLLELANQPDLVNEEDPFQMAKAVTKFFDNVGWKS